MLNVSFSSILEVMNRRTYGERSRQKSRDTKSFTRGSAERNMNKSKKDNLMFWSLWLLVIASLIFISTQISFIFLPIGTFIQTLYIPVVIAGFLYYIFEPLVNLLEKRFSIKRIWGIVLVLIFLFVIIVISIGSLIPYSITQISELVKNFPSIFDFFTDYYDKMMAQDWLEGLHLENQISQLGNDFQNTLTRFLTGLTSSIGRLLTTVANGFILIFIIPFLLFYMLKDGEKFSSGVIRIFPNQYRTDILLILHDMNETIANYISGQAVISLLVGVGTWAGYLIIGLPYGFLLSLFSAITNIIPYIGPYFGLIPAVLIGLTISPLKAFWVCIVVLIVQQIDANILKPNILGKNLDIHPLTIIIILLVSGKMFGLLGMLIGIPAYAVIRTVIIHIYRFIRKQKSRQLEEGNPFQ